MSTAHYVPPRCAGDDPATGLADAYRDLQELNDEVIHRLFGTGMGLRALLTELGDTELARHLERHIADLDDTIGRIRTQMMAVRARRF